MLSFVILHVETLDFLMQLSGVLTRAAMNKQEFGKLFHKLVYVRLQGLEQKLWPSLNVSLGLKLGQP